MVRPVRQKSLPVSTPSNDYYGGERPGDNLFGDSIVCLEAETGRRVWHFQIAHHGLWDYDPPAVPVLVDIEGGRQAHQGGGPGDQAGILLCV